ncbi:MAG: hypothetical protein QXX38_02040 [Candidatus Aenigmatarchaeota archaeon]
MSLSYFISRWIEPYTIIDTSQVIMMDEIFMFNNIKEKALQTVNSSKSCEDLVYNLEEYSSFIRRYSLEKGKLLLEYKFTSPCFEDPTTPAVIEFNITLISPRIKIESYFPAYFVPQ